MLKLEYPSGHKGIIFIIYILFFGSVSDFLGLGWIEDGLVGVYAKIRNAIEGGSSRGNVTIMIDDVSLLEIAARGSADDVLDVLHYCVALTSELVRFCCFFEFD